MTEIVTVKFKNRGKSYYFDPNNLKLNAGDTLVVETSKGLELAECTHGNHNIADTAVVQPLRPVVRKATEADLRVAQINKNREAEAFNICQQQIEEHGLDMKLVDVECNFEGNKTTFFFTSDGRVDFRDLVKDLAGIFRNRIELRQIGVRDEAKMLGGIGICGRPYCCSQFLDDFSPVSTKMAKTQSLSLNPTKISGSCGRLMCCLRYEQDAYEELVKNVPKQGAYVETKDGYGTAVQVNLLRQTVKVKLDNEDDLRMYKPNELASVPGGRPKDGETPPSVLNYVPEEETEEIELTGWETAEELADEKAAEDAAAAEGEETVSEEAANEKKPQRYNNKRRKHSGKNKQITAHVAEGEASKQGQAEQHVKVKPHTDAGEAKKENRDGENAPKQRENHGYKKGGGRRHYRGKRPQKSGNTGNNSQ